ncbi:MAG: metallophosphoesterase, partial [Bacteroidota bacterium]
TPQNMIWASYILGYMVLINFPKTLFVGFLFLEDISRYLRKWTAKEKVSLPSRRKFISQMGLIIAAVPFTSVLYGIIRGKYDYKIHTVELTFEDLPQAFDGFTLTQLSDVHSGSFDSKEAVQRGLDMVQELGSDLIVFTGDIVNDFAYEIKPWISRFAELSAPYGKFSILGNHDYGDSVRWDSPFEKAANLHQLKEYHAQMGFQLLTNQHVAIEKGGSILNLVGVENWGKVPFPQKGDLDLATRGMSKEQFQILLSHDPSHWEEKVLPHDATFHLTLSGHTHGAQFGVELPGWKWSPVKYRYPQWAGHYQKGKEHLYVNRGFGFIGFPGRVGIWPEITQIVLRKK